MHQTPYKSLTPKIDKKNEQGINEDGQRMTRKDSRESSSSLKSLNIESNIVSPTPSRGSNHESNGDIFLFTR